MMGSCDVGHVQSDTRLHDIGPAKFMPESSARDPEERD